MAEAGTLCTNGDVLKMAGANADTTAASEAYTNVYIKMAEGELCEAARYDWVTNYASVSTIGKEILRKATAAYAATMVLNYNMRNYTSRQEALIMINILWAMAQKIILRLEKDNNYKDFILTGAGDID